jgi:hypothetical protein
MLPNTRIKADLDASVRQSYAFQELHLASRVLEQYSPVGVRCRGQHLQDLASGPLMGGTESTFAVGNLSAF